MVRTGLKDLLLFRKKMHSVISSSSADGELRCTPRPRQLIIAAKHFPLFELPNSVLPIIRDHFINRALFSFRNARSGRRKSLWNSPLKRRRRKYTIWKLRRINLTVIFSHFASQVLLNPIVNLWTLSS